MLLGAVAELATLGSLLPLLSLVAGVEQPARLPSFARLFGILGATTLREQVALAGALFGVIALIAGAIRVALNWSTSMFTARCGDELSVDVHERILAQPYAYHLTHSSSQALAAMDKVESLVLHVLLQLLYAIAAGFIAVVIISALIYIEPLTTLIAASAFALVYLLVSAGAWPRLAANSELIRTTYEGRVTIVQESIGGIRDVIIDVAQQVYVGAFATVNRRYSMAAATTSFLAAAPRFAVEAAGMIIIAFAAVLVATRHGGLAYAIPLLGAVALGAQRLLPLLQQVYHGWASVSGHRSVLPEVLELLRLPAPGRQSDPSAMEPLRLRQNISIDAVSFRYPGSHANVIDGVTLKIPRGSTVGLVGITGSGKSTLADLIMGLIEPDEGEIAIDDDLLKAEVRLRWHRSIAHVPQAIFLSDATIAQNIAFGIAPENIRMERVRAAAATAQLENFVSSLPSGYDTTIGERGIRLSGGQRQRLGIARALYKRAPVLILDEATSALDEATEAAVMDGLLGSGGEDRTTIIISHRLSTVARCGLLIRLEGGQVAVTGTYDEVVPARSRNG